MTVATVPDACIQPLVGASFLQDLDFSVVLPSSFALEQCELRRIPPVKARLIGPAGAPVILALGGISANRHVVDFKHWEGKVQSGWWSALAGPGLTLDTSRFRVLSFDFLPGDATAKSSPVTVTPADQARLAALVCDHVGIPKLHAFVGASYGGMVGLQFAALFPERVEHLIVACAAHRPHPLGAAWRSIQRKIVRFGLAHQQASQALSLARELGMTTYRTAEEFGQRFASVSEVEAYLESRGRDFLERMSAERYVCLSRSIDLHEVSPERVAVPVSLVAFRQDQLVPVEEIRLLRDRLPHLRHYFEFDSLYGHDAFLKEVSLMNQVFEQVLS